MRFFAHRSTLLRKLAAVAAAAYAMALLGPAVAPACDASQHLAAKRKPAHGRAPLAIGDSVMLGAADRLARTGFEVDARGCRQMSAGLDLVAQRRRSGTLPRVVIVALGTNWVITRADVRRALRSSARAGCSCSSRRASSVAARARTRRSYAPPAGSTRGGSPSPTGYASATVTAAGSPGTASTSARAALPAWCGCCGHI